MHDVGVLLVQFLWANYSQYETIPYSDFEKLLDDSKISEVAVGQDVIRAKLKAPTSDGQNYFVTTRVDPLFADRLRDKGITVTGLATNNWIGTLLSWVVPIGLFYLVWTFAFRHIAGPSPRKRRSKLGSPSVAQRPVISSRRWSSVDPARGRERRNTGRVMGSGSPDCLELVPRGQERVPPCPFSRRTIAKHPETCTAPVSRGGFLPPRFLHVVRIPDHRPARR